MKKILIIEDEEDMQDIYSDIFKNNKNYSVDIVDGALPAARKLGEKKYDLIILDIIMSPITGESFFVYLKSSRETDHIPVLVVSVLNSGLLEKLKKIDHAHFLQKPIKEEMLFGEIKKILA